MTTRTASRHFTHYLLHSWLGTLRDWSFLAFILAMPVTIYLFFAGIYGAQLSEGGVDVAAIMMVTMATYGALGAAMSAGNQITNERSTGWFRQLMITALTPTHCTITADAQRSAVTDDGRGLTAGANGSGLRGLSERLQTAGGRLEVTSSATGTTVVAELGADR